jgi:hypothetical protein
MCLKTETGMTYEVTDNLSSLLEISYWFQAISVYNLDWIKVVQDCDQ